MRGKSEGERIVSITDNTRIRPNFFFFHYPKVPISFLIFSPPSSAEKRVTEIWPSLNLGVSTVHATFEEQVSFVFVSKTFP